MSLNKKICAGIGQSSFLAVSMVLVAGIFLISPVMVSAQEYSGGYNVADATDFSGGYNVTSPDSNTGYYGMTWQNDYSGGYNPTSSEYSGGYNVVSGQQDYSGGYNVTGTNSNWQNDANVGYTGMTWQGDTTPSNTTWQNDANVGYAGMTWQGDSTPNTGFTWQNDYTPIYSNPSTGYVAPTTYTTGSNAGYYPTYSSGSGYYPSSSSGYYPSYTTGYSTGYSYPASSGYSYSTPSTAARTISTPASSGYSNVNYSSNSYSCMNGSCNTTVTDNSNNSINGSFNTTNSGNTSTVYTAPATVTTLREVSGSYYPVQYTYPSYTPTYTPTYYTGSTNYPTCQITATPNSIASGQLVTLSWTSNNASTAYLFGGSVNVTGVTSIYPTQTTTYELTVYNNQGLVGRCQTTVAVGGYYSAPVSSAPYVSLSQIPYTGFDFGPVGNAMYWISILAFAAAASYLVLYYRGGSGMVLASLGGGRRSAMPSIQTPKLFRKKVDVLATLANLPVREEAHVKPVVAQTVEMPKDAMTVIRSKDGAAPRIIINRQ